MIVHVHVRCTQYVVMSCMSQTCVRPLRRVRSYRPTRFEKSYKTLRSRRTVHQRVRCNLLLSSLASRGVGCTLRADGNTLFTYSLTYVTKLAGFSLPLAACRQDSACGVSHVVSQVESASPDATSIRGLAGQDTGVHRQSTREGWVRHLGYQGRSDAR